MSLKLNTDNPWYKKTGRNVVFSFRIDEAVYDVIKEISAAEGRSINTQLLRFVEDGLIAYLEGQENK